MSAARIAASLLAVAALAASGGAAEAPAPGPPAEPLLADRVAQLERELADAGIGATVEAVEEGAFMLGAYPRSRVFWRVRLAEPASDDALRRLADSALDLRPGVVWLSIPDDDGGRRLVTFSDHRSSE